MTVKIKPQALKNKIAYLLGLNAALSYHLNANVMWPRNPFNKKKKLSEYKAWNRGLRA